MTLIDKVAKKAGRRVHGWRNEKDLTQRLASIAHLFAGNFTSSLIGLAAFALTARALGPSQYGTLALCYAFTRAVERLLSFQSWQPLIKFGAEAKESGAIDDLRQLMKFGLLLDAAAAFLAFVVAMLLVLLAAPLVGISEEARTLAAIYCFVLPFQLSGMPTAVLRLYGKFPTLAYGQVATSAVRVCLCGLGVALSWGLLEFTLIWLGMQIVSALSMVLLAFRELRKRGLSGVLSVPVLGVTKRFPGLWRFAFSANLSLTIRSSANELDTLLVGYLAGPAAAGLYHIARRIGRLAQQGGVQVQAVVYPELARLWSGAQITGFARVVRQTQWMLLAGGVALVLSIYLSIEPLLRWAAGADFEAAAPLVIVQAVAVMMTLCGSVLRSALLAMGLQGKVLQSVLLSTAAFHLTALMLIPQIGAMGANVAHIVMATIWMAAMTLAYRSELGRISRNDIGAA